MTTAKGKSPADAASPRLRGRRIIRPLWILVVFLAIVLVVRTWVIAPFHIPTDSMAPTLLGDDPRQEREGDIVLVSMGAYLFTGPARWDLVAFHEVGAGTASTPGPRIVKRVVGLPEETVEIFDGEISVNGLVIEHPPALSECRYRRTGKFGHRAITLGKDEYFVLGDNSTRSADSRHWGALPRARIFGKIVAIILPLERARWIGP